jgi:hypothetical protein
MFERAGRDAGGEIMENKPLPLICKNCGKTSGSHTWVTRKCEGQETYEELIPLDEYIIIQEESSPR